MAEISVIIPAYNAEKTIVDSVRSALDQTFTDIEVIVSDDGSVDDTLSLLEEIKDSRLKVISSLNSGAAAARNRGIHNSKGEFIAFLDADDLWLKDKLELQLNVLKSNPLASTVYCWVDTFDEKSKNPRATSRTSVSGDIYINLLKNCFIVSGSNILVRKEALESIGLWDENLEASQDYDLYLRLAEKYEFVNVPQVLVWYRMSCQSMSTDFKRLEKTSLYVRKRALSKLPAEIQREIESDVIGGYYKSTIWRYLELPAHPSKGLLALKYLIQILKFDHQFIFHHTKLTLTIIIKSTLFMFGLSLDRD